MCLLAYMATCRMNGHADIKKRRMNGHADIKKKKERTRPPSLSSWPQRFPPWKRLWRYVCLWAVYKTAQPTRLSFWKLLHRSLSTGHQPPQMVNQLDQQCLWLQRGRDPRASLHGMPPVAAEIQSCWMLHRFLRLLQLELLPTPHPPTHTPSYARPTSHSVDCHRDAAGQLQSRGGLPGM